MLQTATLLQLRFGNKLDRVLVDTEAARGGSPGANQYHASWSFVGQKPNVDRTRAAVCQLGIGSPTFQGMASIWFSIGDIWLSFNVHMGDADAHILQSTDDLERLEIYLNNVGDALVHPEPGTNLLHGFVVTNSFSRTRIPLDYWHLLSYVEFIVILDIPPPTSWWIF